jgi:Helix-turn-helix domain
MASMAKHNTIFKRGKTVITAGGDSTQTQLAAAAPKASGEGTASARGPPDALLTPQETADVLRCSVSSLNKWRISGGGPLFTRIGGRIRYRPSDIAAFIRQGLRASTSTSEAENA